MKINGNAVKYPTLWAEASAKILAQKIGEEVVLLNSSGRMIIYKLRILCWKL
jgi:hypothetical protein